MFCQKPIKDDIIQDYKTGEYYKNEDKDNAAEYEKYINKYTSILNYQNGIWVTCYAMANLINGLGSCAKLWLYSDTDSAYSIGWDMEKLNAYNEQCKAKLRANGYDCVMHNGREYWLGLAEFDGEYSEFVALHSKCYACRRLDGSIKLTVAGVPKKSGADCLNNDLRNFKAGFVFDGNITGKKTYQYFIREQIFIDADGNECGDSINFVPCNYELSNAKIGTIDDLFREEVFIEEYE